jgi:hypothetical protein
MHDALLVGSDVDGGTCNAGGVTYPEGASWKCDCNTCFCDHPPEISTTLVACDEDGGATVDANPGDDAGSCPATCGTPAGLVATLVTPSDVYAVIGGSWQVCGSAGTAFGAPADAIGLEFDPVSGTPASGNAYYLVSGPTGPVRGSGFAYQLTYDVSGGGASGPLQLNVHPTPNSGWGGSIRYSPCPMELEINDAVNASSSTLVRFSGDAGVGSDDTGVHSGDGGASCQTAQDCTAAVPTLAEICPDGGSAPPVWACVSSMCQLVPGCD